MATSNELIAHLIAAGIGTAEATDWFINQMPDTPDICYVVYNTGGPAPLRDFGSSVWSREYPTLQLRFRGVPGDSDGPHVKAQAAYEAVSTIMVATLSGTYYYSASPAQVPFILRKDERDRVEWVFNVNTEKELSA